MHTVPRSNKASDLLANLELHCVHFTWWEDIENANHRTILIGFVHLFICICHLSMHSCLFYRVSHFSCNSLKHILYMYNYTMRG